MARPARGKNVLKNAKEQLSKTTTVNELRTLQSVVFPLVNGMSTT